MATPTNLPASAVAGQVLTAAYVNQLAGAFRVLQVVQGTTSTSVSTSGNTFVDTSLSASITPQATSNKVLVFVSQNNCAKATGNIDNSVFLQLLRASTSIQEFANFGLFTGSSLDNRGSFSTVYLDSPNTTSAVTYKTQFRNAVAAASVTVQASGGSSSIILMEISA
jgi:hypothetical protein